ncbi:MAG: hypothetical protein F6J95_001285 [Leptolyngbya sp. SIO1E4]|nr:hypothetical protein [Leptolyngbya sp. SIO1E4]
MATRILLQTTLLPTDTDDWTIHRFSLIRGYLSGLKDDAGNFLFEVTARDRRPDAEGNDPVLSTLSRDQFDELWLFALDVGDGLSTADCEGITRFHRAGGGILTTRDHQDMGISMCALGTLGPFHHFRSRQNPPDPDHCVRDDPYTTTIDWPNYHSGANGDYQIITPVDPLHPLLKSANGAIQYFLAHPHEGGVSVPADMPHARVIATGKSRVTKRPFNLVVVADRALDENGNMLGRVVAQSTFHHFVDYNIDTDMGCPSFVDEPPGQGVKTHPVGLADIYTYFWNLALWLAPDAA